MAHFEFGAGNGGGGNGAGFAAPGGGAGFGGSQQPSIFAQQPQQPQQQQLFPQPQHQPQYQHQHQQQAMHAPPPQGQIPRHPASAAQNNADPFGTHARMPPTGTPSSYGQFIPKRGRVGSIGTGGGGGAGTSVGSVGSVGRMSSSLSGRLRAVSDLDRMGLVNLTQKGRLKDLIINGDESLRIALEKYEAGDLSELEQLIGQGHLSTSSGTSIGSFDALDLDALDLGPLGTEFMSGSLGSLKGTSDLARAASDDTARSRTSSLTGGNGVGGHSGVGAGSTTAASQWGDWDNAVSGGGVEFEMDDLGEDLGVLEGYPVPMRRPYDIFPLSSQQQQQQQSSSNSHASNAHHHMGGVASNPSSAMAAAAAAAASNSSNSLGSAGLSSNSMSGGGGGGGNTGMTVPSLNSGAASHGTRGSRGGNSSKSGYSKSGGGGGGGGSGGSRRTGGGSTQQPTITAQGTVNFPNSVNTGSKYPISNSVSELPALATLPPGQAPAYEQLINFQRAKSKDAVRCVMCGRAPTDGDGPAVVIPQQNKDVCRDCDKALWVHGESRTYFKWCKGCKRFRNIVAFSEKLDASKCNGCRERGRRSYLQRKGVPGGPDDPAVIAAAGGAPLPGGGVPGAVGGAVGGSAGGGGTGAAGGFATGTGATMGALHASNAATFQAAPGQLAQQPVPGQAQEVGQGNIFAYGNTPHA
jgi:hypothetical protein